MGFFFKRKMARRLAKVGASIDTCYMLYVNNEEAITFPTKEDCISYLQQFRENNIISRIQIYRIETYSL
jgi:hypothetical protein